MLGRATAIALPYRWIEGSGVLSTALAQGVPPVVTAVGTFPELCADYDLGDPVPPDDPAAFALALVRTPDRFRRPSPRHRGHGTSPSRADLGTNGPADPRPVRTSAREQEAGAVSGRGRGSALADPSPPSSRSRPRWSRLAAGEGDLYERATPESRVPWHPEVHAASPRTLALLVCVLVPCAAAAAASPPGDARAARGHGRLRAPCRRRSAARLRAASTMRAPSRSALTGSRSTSPPRRLRASRRSASRPERPARAAQPRRRLRRVRRAGRLRRRARARRGLGDRRLARQPPRLRRLGHAGAVASVRAPAQRVARAARGESPGASPRSRRRAATPRRRWPAPMRSRISPDGRFVYVAAGTADAIIAFSRDAATGRLTPLAGAAGCLRADRAELRAGHAASTGRRRSRSRPTGRRSTSSSATAGTLTAFQRDVEHGSADAAAARRRVPERRALADCTPIGGLARASAVAVTPDGRTVVAVGTDDDAVLSLRRDPATSGLTRVVVRRGHCRHGRLHRPAADPGPARA